MTCNELRRAAVGLAWNLGCNMALVNAFRYCRSLADLRRTAEQAAGPGSDRVRAYVLGQLESSQ